MTTPVRIGIIGAGGIARAHARAYQRLPDVEVVAVADIVPGLAEKFAAEFDIPQWFDSHQALLALDEVEAVQCLYL